LKTENFAFSLDYASKIVWGPALLLLLFAAGLYLTAFSGFFPLRKTGFIIKSTFGGIFKNKKSLNRDF
jgi:Na+/alanine symporter